MAERDLPPGTIFGYFAGETPAERASHRREASPVDRPAPTVGCARLRLVCDRPMLDVMRLFRRRKSRAGPPAPKQTGYREEKFYLPEDVYPDLPEKEATALWLLEMHKAYHAKGMPHDHSPDDNLPPEVLQDAEHQRQHADGE